MKTEDLISLLATGAAPVDPHVVARRFSWALIAGALGSTLLMALAFGVRRDLATVAATPLFWLKVALPFFVALGALLATVRLARPGVAPRMAWAAIAWPVAAVWLAAIALVWLAPPEARLPLVMGQTWRVCPFAIAFLSIPSFAAVFWALRGLAPTRLRATGFAGGLLASATATLAYCLHCPEMGVPFWAIWYLLGMAIPAALGAWFGPRLLRW
ncbi:DUF1109 domain-containing protein [Paraburkholderia sp. J12]|uniref:DUF1109 domain-containing protein n=1 Tax=Paraburkholderia sp. J12 TaxID=2805432 RepID=UPI002ABDE994|nr:DUF1109 domain-containing protein [Paraburkholderia sp. J12]